MRYFDLHCDTIYECVKQNLSLQKNELAIDLNRGKAFSTWVQTFGFWIPDCFRGEEAYDCFLKQYNYFQSACSELEDLQPYHTGMEKPHCCNGLLAVEGGAALKGDLDVIWDFKRKGIRMLTLTWNGKNEIAAGAAEDGGLTSFGERAVTELEQAGIIIDLSHLNETSFWDVLKRTTRPMVATHSNADAICHHQRNLKDAQIKAIIERGGLIGINFFVDFLSNAEITDTFETLGKHIDHFLSLGCEKHLAIGSDFDGAKMPNSLEGIECIPNLYKFVQKRYGNFFAERLFFENASEFFKGYKKDYGEKK